MILGDFINELMKHDLKLPVCVSDWQEEYQDPSENAAEIISEVEGEYTSSEDDSSGYPLAKEGKFLCIG